MVVFTCGHCGESVQKPKVEKHYLTKCRNRNPNLSCMDCFKDFLGTDYENHTKCITEEERYSGKGFMAKEKKGEKKQNTWVEMLQSVLDEQKNIAGNVRRIIETVSKHNNTPRKKPKFINFVKNVCGHKTNLNDIDQAWDFISVKLSDLSNAPNKNQNQKKQIGDANGDANGEANGEANGDANGDAKLENSEAEADTSTKEIKVENNENEEESVEVKPAEVEGKKLSKKQKKEEKKRQKYEAELQSAVAPPAEEEEEGQSKKDKKKKKNRTESQNGNADEYIAEDSKEKKKKRKRQDTTNSVTEVVVNGNDKVENEPVVKEKTLKKKLKVGEVEPLDESVCLHDQNVALTEEEVPLKNGNFDWHAVIISVLEKKGNEVPFKRLQKKVLSEFSEMTGQDVDDRIADKFIKKLKSAPKVRVDKNRVLLVQ